MWELIEYTVIAFTFLPSDTPCWSTCGRRMSAGSNVADLLYIYLNSLSARAITILFSMP